MALDSMEAELVRRFDGVGLVTMITAEEILGSATKGVILEEKIAELTKELGDDLDETRFTCELQVLQSVAKDKKTVEEV
jgi:hypothetical protein